MGPLCTSEKHGDHTIAKARIDAMPSLVCCLEVGQCLLDIAGRVIPAVGLSSFLPLDGYCIVPGRLGSQERKTIL